MIYWRVIYLSVSRSLYIFFYLDFSMHIISSITTFFLHFFTVCSTFSKGQFYLLIYFLSIDDFDLCSSFDAIKNIGKKPIICSSNISLIHIIHRFLSYRSTQPKPNICIRWLEKILYFYQAPIVRFCYNGVCEYKQSIYSYFLL